jgi:serine/threonine protein kinase
MSNLTADFVFQELSHSLPHNIQLIRKCGEGGMGIVFEAFHSDWGIPIAVKTSKTRSLPHAQAFSKEMEVWADLGTHPYLVTLFYTKTIAELPCVFSEFIPASSLDHAIKRKEIRSFDEELTLSKVLSIATSTAWGLAEAHNHDLAHCDFKPSNVFLDSEHIAKVGDFGLTKSFLHKEKHQGHTPLYASPEQLRGENVSAATDFWSWAATVFEMFIPEPLWSSGAAVSHSFQDYLDSGAKSPGYPKMPREIIFILRSCFQNDPAKRCNSFQDIAEQIVQIHCDILGFDCPAQKPRKDLIAADSLNCFGSASIGKNGLRS